MVVDFQGIVINGSVISSADPPKTTRFSPSYAGKASSSVPWRSAWGESWRIFRHNEKSIQTFGGLAKRRLDGKNGNTNHKEHRKNGQKMVEKWWKTTQELYILLGNKYGKQHITMAIFLDTFWAAFSLKITPPKFKIETKKDDGCISGVQTWRRSGYLVVKFRGGSSFNFSFTWLIWLL